MSLIIGIDASRANRRYKSGTEWYSYYLIQEFAKLDKENKFVLYTDVPLEPSLKRLVEENKNFEEKVLNWPFQFLWTQGRLSLEMLCCKPDILFIPAHALPFVHPKKSITTIHDIGFARNSLVYNCADKISGGIGLNRFSSIEYLKWSTKFALRNAYKVITISDFSKREIADVYGEKNLKKISVIHNGYNDKLYKTITNKEKISEIINKYDIESPYILYVGRLEKKKNIASLIEAFATMRLENSDLRKYKLVLVGNAGFGYCDINYLISEFDLEDDVIMPGWVNEEDIPYLYNGADLFVFPSLYEGFGIPVLQAFACGVPVAASMTTSIPEVAEDAAVLFNPKEPESIAEAMAKVLSNEKLRNALKNKGFERVKSFGWAKCAKETLEKILS